MHTSYPRPLRKPWPQDAVVYNEIEPFAARWLANLTRADHIAFGRVETRSITDIRPDEVRHAHQFHTFAGLGAWSYALRLAGWPEGRPVWTGSCPCQPFSDAGDQRGFDDPRHLWPAWFRLIEECRPVTVFGEQVDSKPGRAWLDLVHADLEGAGYTVGTAVLPAASVGAPHGRHRIFFVATLGVADAGRKQRGQVGAFVGGSGGGGGAQGAGQRFVHGGAVLDLADAGRAGLPDAEPPVVPGPRRREEGRAVEQRRVPPARGLADSIGKQPHRAGAARRGDTQLADGGPWDDPEWLHCRDGKWRPTQSGLRPLVDRLAPGVAGVRAGSLKGYGNAIVPQIAAAFIRAFLDHEAEMNLTG